MERSMMPDITKTVEQIQSLNRQELLVLEPEVTRIIKTRSQDQRRIEGLLDRLLDCAGTGDDGLDLFKRLCRYYYRLNPAAAADYVRFYHEMYGEDGEEES